MIYNFSLCLLLKVDVDLLIGDLCTQSIIVMVENILF